MLPAAQAPSSHGIYEEGVKQSPARTVPHAVYSGNGNAVGSSNGGVSSNGELASSVGAATDGLNGLSLDAQAKRRASINKAVAASEEAAEYLAADDASRPRDFDLDSDTTSPGSARVEGSPQLYMEASAVPSKAEAAAIMRAGFALSPPEGRRHGGRHDGDAESSDDDDGEMPAEYACGPPPPAAPTSVPLAAPTATPRALVPAAADTLQQARRPSASAALPPAERREEGDEDVDEMMLTRTLQQLARRQRTLASLRVQLAQAEQMLGTTSEQQNTQPNGGEGGAAPRVLPPGARKWLRTAATLRAAIGLLTPMPEALIAQPSTNPAIESCVVDGYLLRLCADGKEWRRMWYCLKGLDGLLIFDAELERVPRGHVAFDFNTIVESPVVGEEKTTAPPLPSDAFRLRTGAGGVFTFACPEDEFSLRTQRHDSGDWVEAIRAVVSVANEQAESACLK